MGVALKNFSLAFVVVVLAGGIASAQSKPQRKKLPRGTDPCVEEVYNRCGGLCTSDSQVSGLSGKCREFGKKGKAMYDAAKIDCAGDVSRFCPGAHGTAMMGCIIKNSDKLMPACKKNFPV